MKNQIISTGSLLLALLLLTVSVVSEDLTTAEISKATAIVLLLISMRYVQDAGMMENR